MILRSMDGGTAHDLIAQHLMQENRTINLFNLIILDPFSVVLLISTH